MRRPAPTRTTAAVGSGLSLGQRWRDHRAPRRRERLISPRSRRILAQWLRRTASRTYSGGDRVDAVRSDLLTIAALLEQAPDPDPTCIAELYELLSNGCDSPLYNAHVHRSELRATLYYSQCGLATDNPAMD